MNKNLLPIALCLSLLISTVCIGSDNETAQQPKFRTSGDVVGVQALPGQLTTSAGKRIEFKVKIDILDHWHLYAHEDTSFIGIDLTLDEGCPLEEIKMAYPAGVVGEFFGEPTVMLAGNQSIDVSAAVKGSLAKGDHDLKLFLTVQACDDKRCLAPADLPVILKLKVE